MRTLVITLFAPFALVACAAGAPDAAENDQSASVTAADAGPSTPTFAAIAPLLNAACGQCHGAAFSTVDKVKRHRTTMIDLITAGDMPQDNPSWGNTADGRRVVDYLQRSPELQ